VILNLGPTEQKFTMTASIQVPANCNFRQL